MLLLLDSLLYMQIAKWGRDKTRKELIIFVKAAGKTKATQFSCQVGGTSSRVE